MIVQRFDLSDRSALITGGGTGLGEQFAVVLADAGATVILCARRVEKLQASAARIRQAGGKAVCIPMDVTDASSIKAAFEQAQEFAPISIVVNNAGTSVTPTLLEMTEQEWDQVLDTNLKGAWLVAKEAANRLVAQGVGGSVINIVSMLGSAVQKRLGAYSASKAGLIHLTRSMALEWARYGIRVNAIAPGYVVTDLTDDFLNSSIGEAMVKRIPQRRLGTLEDMNGAILLLASDASDYMTGTVITVDGGHSLAVI